LALISNVYTHADGNCTYVKSIVFGASSGKCVAEKTVDKNLLSKITSTFISVWFEFMLSQNV